MKSVSVVQAWSECQCDVGLMIDGKEAVGLDGAITSFASYAIVEMLY